MKLKDKYKALKQSNEKMKHVRTVWGGGRRPGTLHLLPVLQTMAEKLHGQKAAPEAEEPVAAADAVELRARIAGSFAIAPFCVPYVLSVLQSLSG